MAVFDKIKHKYGCEIAGYLEGVVSLGLAYDCWTFNQKTRKSRKKRFKKMFNGNKLNYKPEFKLNLN